MQSSDPLDKLAPALVAAQADMTNPPLDGVNPHFKSKFTTLAAMIDHVRPVFAKHGLAVIQHPVSDAGEVGVETMVVHESGQALAERFTIPLDKHDPQAAGSIITYFRRYALAAVAGIQGDEDTDAEPNRTAAPQASPSAPSRPSQPASGPAQGSGAKEASEKQVKMLFALGHKLGIAVQVQESVHAIKAKHGIIPMAWVSKQIDRLQEGGTVDDGDARKTAAKEPDGSESFEEWANAQDDDETDIPF